MNRVILILLNIIILVNISFAETYQVVKERVKLYAKPDFEYEIGYLTKGYEIKSLSRHDDKWSYFDDGKVYGYIENNDIQLTSEEEDIKTYQLIAGIIIGLIIMGIILNAIYGKEKISTYYNEQYIDNRVIDNSTFLYKNKSVTIAIILTMFFGPFGMLYSTIKGALAMIILPIILLISTVFAFGSENALLKILLASSSIAFFILYWFICVIWGAVAASNSIKVKKI